MTQQTRFKWPVQREFLVFLLTISFLGCAVIADESILNPTKQDWGFSDGAAVSVDAPILLQNDLAQLPVQNGFYPTVTPFATYSRRRTVLVDNTMNASVYSNYAVRVVVPYDADMQSDFDDIRFTAGDGTTELSYYLETKSDGVSAVFWVKVPSVAASVQTTIYMYYGNPGVTTTSNGANVFYFFDDFEVFSGWSNLGTGSFAQSNDTSYQGLYSGKKDTNGDPNGGQKNLSVTVSRTGKNWIVETFVRRNTPLTAGGTDRVSIENSSNNGYGFDFVHGANPTVQMVVRNAGSATVQSIVALPSDLTNDWYLGQILMTPTTVQTRIRKKDYSILGQSAVVTHSANVNLTREAIRGGFPYYVDMYRVREYVANEPSTTVGDETIFYEPSKLTVKMLTPIVFDQLFEFGDALGPNNAGLVNYELGLDANKDGVVDAWYYANAGMWTVVTDPNTQFSTVSEINAILSEFPNTVGKGQLFVKAFLRSNGQQAVELSHIYLSYNTESSVSSLAVVNSSDGSHLEQVFWTPFDPNSMDASNLRSTLEYSVDGGTTWFPCSLQSGMNAVPGSSGVQQSDGWMAEKDLPVTTDLSAVLLRVTVSDSWMTGPALNTSPFPLDFVQPVLKGYGVNVSNVAADFVALDWQPVDDSNFSHYEIWYSSDPNAVEQRDVHLATMWSSAQDPLLDFASTVTSTLKMNPSGYFFGVHAVDSFGNDTFLGDVFVTLSCHHNSSTPINATIPTDADASAVPSEVVTPSDSTTVDENQDVSIDATVEEATESVQEEEQEQEQEGTENNDEEVPEIAFEWNLPNHWSQSYLEYLEQQNVITEEVEDDPVFVKLLRGILTQPDLAISRLDALHFAMILAGYKVDENTAISTGFSDVEATQPLSGLLEYAHDAGLVSGYADGGFHPKQGLSRAEAITFLYRIFEKDEPLKDLRNEDLLKSLTLDSSPFCDVDLNSWYAPYVLDAYVHGVIQGNAGTYYYPNRAITRAEFVKVALLIQHLEDASKLVQILEP